MKTSGCRMIDFASSQWPDHFELEAVGYPPTVHG